jgi:uncharacterized iron-regulated membrane protein
MHLAAGLGAGVVIGIMCFTGAALAFEQEIVAWGERDARQVAVPPEAARLPLAELQRQLRETQPEFRATAVTIERDPAAAVTFSAGRDSDYYANPYTGEIRQPASAKARDFMQVMTDWHRYLARTGEQRAVGKLINGVGNLAFCFLALSGLWLWMPRTWSRRGVRAVAVLNPKLSGKARDFNWHNAIGLWCAPILIVLTLTAVPMSFRWGANLVYQIAGEEIPAPTSPGAAPTVSAVEIKRPSPETRPLSYDAIVASVQKDYPEWTQISLRSGGGPRGGAGVNPPAGREGASPVFREGNGAAQPLTATVREAGSWPRTATTTLTLNPFTGELLNRSGYADLTAARRIRSWTRFLHTGQALGGGGQLMAGLACLGGCFLLYTGFALSWRRFFGKMKIQPKTGPSA